MNISTGSLTEDDSSHDSSLTKVLERDVSKRASEAASVVCHTRCDPGKSCVERDNKIGCQSCTRGYFSTDGLGCDACSCAKSGTRPAICHKITGHCFCDNILNLCSKIPIFGSTSTLAWFLLVVAAVSFLVLGQFWLRNRRNPIDGADVLEETEAMLQLQQVMAQLQGVGSVNKLKRNLYSPDSQSPGFSSQTNRSGKGKLASLAKLPGLRSQSRIKQTHHKRISLMSSKSDLDEVTTAILSVAKEKIHEAKKRSMMEKPSLAHSRAGVEGKYYIDRITGRPVTDIAMDAEAEGQILSVIFPAPDDYLNYQAEENPTDVNSSRSFNAFGDEDATSLHFGDSIYAAEVKEAGSATKKKKKKG